MKTVARILLFIFVLQSAALAQTDYEKKLEYHRKKLQIMVKTYYIGENSGYSNYDTSYYGYSATPEGFSYGNSSTTGTSRGYSSIREVSDWKIIKGGIRELTDLEFLEIIGDRERADEVARSMDEKGRQLMWGLGCGVFGVGSIVAAGSSTPANPTLMSVGTVLMLAGIYLSYIGTPPRHYLTPDYAQEGTDNYNIKLKKALVLPIETE